MKSKKTIVFYCDVNIYSGHDIMSVRIANSLSSRYTVKFMFVHQKYSDDLDDTVHKIPLKLKNSGTGIVNLLLKSWNDIFSIRKIIKTIQPDIFIVCQGEYHLCLKGMIAALLAGNTAVISYIPITYPYSIIQGAFNSLRNFLYRVLVQGFQAFITISVEQENLLKRYLLLRRPVYVLENMTDFPQIQIPRKKRKSVQYGIIARIQPSKGQIKTIEITEHLRLIRKDFKFILFGEGDEKELLQKAIREKQLERFYDFKGWVEDKKKIYSEIDVLLLLSEIEGVPLVFLESLYFEIPVLASRLRGNPVYERYIDDEFVFSSIDEIITKMANIEQHISRFKSRSKYYKKLVIERHGKENFEKNLFALFERLP